MCRLLTVLLIFTTLKFGYSQTNEFSVGVQASPFFRLKGANHINKFNFSYGITTTYCFSNGVNFLLSLALYDLNTKYELFCTSPLCIDSVRISRSIFDPSFSVGYRILKKDRSQLFFELGFCSSYTYKNHYFYKRNGIEEKVMYDNFFHNYNSVVLSTLLRYNMSKKIGFDTMLYYKVNPKSDGIHDLGLMVSVTYLF